MVSQVVNLRLAGDVPRKERRTTGNVGECRRNPLKMRRICATPHLGEELLEKMGILEKTPEKKVEIPRKEGEPSLLLPDSLKFYHYVHELKEVHVHE